MSLYASVNIGIPYTNNAWTCLTNEVPTDDENVFKELIRSSKKRCGPSPAVGLACESGPIKAPGDVTIYTKAHILRMYSSDPERLSTYTHLDTYWGVQLSANSYGYNKCSISFVDLRTAKITTKSWRDGGKIYRKNVIESGGIYWWTSQYGDWDAFIDWDPALLEWGADEWYDWLNSHSHRSSSWSNGTYVRMPNGEYWYTSYIASNVPATPRPAQPQLHESFSPNGNVTFNRFPLDAGPYGLSGLITEAVLDALERVPVDRVNYIEQILELFSCITGAVEHIVKGASAKVIEGRAAAAVAHASAEMASSGWLSKRYVVDTTTMDLEELQDVARRVTKLIMRGAKDFTCHGVAQSDHYTVKVSITFSLAQLLDLNNPIQKLRRMWAYDVWDLVPFSFILDWFLGVGDFLEEKAEQEILVQAPPKEAWCSISYNSNVEGCDPTSHYLRFRLEPSDLTRRRDYFEYCESKRNPSLTTIVKRSLDTLSIGFGLV